MVDLSGVSPILPSPPPREEENPLVIRYKTLWNNWCQHPTKETADTLLNFIKQHHDAFAQLAKGATPPYPGADFEHDYATAVNYLQQWIDAGCPPDQTTPPNEFISDVYLWINTR